MKNCSRCKQEKPFNEFYKDKGQRSGLTPSCKKCLFNSQPFVRVPPSEIKKCPDCNQVKKSDEFRRAVRNIDGLQGYCKLCENQRKNASKYKMTIQKYRKAISKGCEVCSSYERLCIDHDHKCCPGKYPCGKCNRGVLCHSCNFVEGRIQSKKQLLSLLAYMEKHGLL
jgi:hypothetical protein